MSNEAISPTPANTWYLYIIENKLGQLYTGITTDPERRFKEHSSDNKKGAKALRGKGPLTLRFCQAVSDKRTAHRLEYWLKRQTKQRKLAMIDEELRLIRQ